MAARGTSRGDDEIVPDPLNFGVILDGSPAFIDLDDLPDEEFDEHEEFELDLFTLGDFSDCGNSVQVPAPIIGDSSCIGNSSFAASHSGQSSLPVTASSCASSGHSIAFDVSRGFTSDSGQALPVGASSSANSGESSAFDVPRGFRSEPAPDLVEAACGNDIPRSHRNNCWVTNRIDELRAHLKLNTDVHFADLPFSELDPLLVQFFQRVVKIKNSKSYPSSSLMNMVNSINRMIRLYSDKRAVRNLPSIPDTRNFNILTNQAFVQTRMVIDAALTKSSKEGCNIDRKKSPVITEKMEREILLHPEHQVTSPRGVQKRLAYYLLSRFCIRGGTELHGIARSDLCLFKSSSNREGLKYHERLSKNNKVTSKKYNPEQFRRPTWSCEPDFLLTFKEYVRHLHPLSPGDQDSLFMSSISNPRGEVWFNKTQKVSVNTIRGWMPLMVKTAGYDPVALGFNNRSGRVSMITRMACAGVSTDVGMLVSGHRSADGYSRYNRTEDLKMEAAILAGASGGHLTYQEALQEVSRDFIQDKIVGAVTSNMSDSQLAASTSTVSGDETKQLTCIAADFVSAPSAVVSGLSTGEPAAKNLNPVPPGFVNPSLSLPLSASQAKLFDDAYWRNMDWDSFCASTPEIMRAMRPVTVTSVDNSINNNLSNLSNCTIHITISNPVPVHSSAGTVPCPPPVANLASFSSSVVSPHDTLSVHDPKVRSDSRDSM